MLPPTHSTTLLVCVLVLCGLRDALLSRRGHCAENQCLALFQEPDTFLGARKSCRNSGGQLLPFRPENTDSFQQTPPGQYWLELAADGAAEAAAAAAGFQNCPSITVRAARDFTVSWTPCGDSLDGFLCQFTFEEPCGGLQAGGAVQVKYTAPMDFEVDDSETFPPGTIAVSEKLGAKYLDSKHVCFSGGWMAAPWTCEVLWGGCEHDCSRETNACTCPAGRTLHANNIACTEGLCEDNPCTGEGEECQITPGGFNCTCSDGFVEEDGACVDVTICDKCEHMLCDKLNGVYQCFCQKGFAVSSRDPTKCELVCTERDCPGTCIRNENAGYQCFCPNGYIRDVEDVSNVTNAAPFCTDIDECESEQCDHKCENSFGSFRCLCDGGFKLHHNGYTCVEEEEEDGSGSTPGPDPTPAAAGAVPSYVKTGSVLGIGVFVALCAALLCFLIRKAVNRCGKFELSSFKHPDIDIFYLQQVTTETYKRLSFDKQFKNDPQIL